MFPKILSLCLVFPLICATTVRPGVYYLVNLGHPYASASFDSLNRVVLPQDFSGNYDLWRVFAGANSIMIQNVRENKYAQVSSPAEGRFVSAGSHPSTFSTVLSGTADFPGVEGVIPDTHIDYWTIGAPNGLVWTYDDSAGPEVSLRLLDANRTAGQYWMFAAEGSLPFLPRDLTGATLSPRLTFSSPSELLT